MLRTQLPIYVYIVYIYCAHFYKCTVYKRVYSCIYSTCVRIYVYRRFKCHESINTCRGFIRLLTKSLIPGCVAVSFSLCLCFCMLGCLTPVTESHAPEQRAVNCWKAFTLPLSWLVDLLLRGVPWRLSCKLTHASCGRLMGPHDGGGWGCLDEVCV